MAGYTDAISPHGGSNGDAGAPALAAERGSIVLANRILATRNASTVDVR